MKHTYRATIDQVPAPGGLLTLSDEAGHHLVRVARRGEGDEVEVIDPQGDIWPALVEVAGPPVGLRVGAAPRPAPALIPLDLYIGALEWGRFDLVVEKCTEIGVAQITMFTSERSGRKLDQAGFDGRADRLARLADAAAKQSGRGARCAVRGLVPFSTVIAQCGQQGFVVDQRAAIGLGQAVRQAAPERAAVIVGSEAGFSPAELAQAEHAGLHICGLGTSTLRAETAALVAVAIAADGLGVVGVG
jgi:16S rRNA (uracil1498-N3)-methyltransferase